MRFKPLFNIIGALLTILGSSMTIPIFISFFNSDYDLDGFLYSSISSQCSILSACRRRPGSKKNKRDGVREKKERKEMKA